ncbi:hypothetical protein PHYBOEH_011708 [Phytophthora boehmeriae]|uniref:Uncharacterized protein n=1 Tax=Phytophthora boehmeriae TaxID=109152 RepID=A0A8T1VFQ8_9STRA|nr:hypothetical protein PHYBOEH_011708 [Phytophthora boehmeriae]
MVEKYKPGVTCADCCEEIVDGSTWAVNENCLQFDHSYEQCNIRKSLDFALKRIVTFGARQAKWDLAYIKRNAPDFGLKPHSELTELQRNIASIVKLYVDLEAVLRDLYGANIVLRCPNCHNKAKHPEYDENRYVLNPDLPQILHEDFDCLASIPMTLAKRMVQHRSVR